MRWIELSEMSLADDRFVACTEWGGVCPDRLAREPKAADQVRLTRRWMQANHAIVGLAMEIADR